MTRKFAAASCLLAGMALMCGESGATEVFQNTSITIGTTSQAKADGVFGTGTSDEKLNTFRAEHFGVHSFGDNYFFVDVYNGKAVGGNTAGSFGGAASNQYAFVWNGRASLSKISGTKVGAGVIDDVSIMYRMERGSYADYTANMIGPSLNLKVPGFAWFQTSLLYDSQNYSGASSDFKKGHAFWHNYMILPFEIAGAKFTFAPLLWVNFSPEKTVGTEVYVEPDLWVKLGDTPVDLGLRVQYHSYKNYSRTSPTLMARWNF